MLESFKVRHTSSLLFISVWLMLYLLSSFAYNDFLGYCSTSLLIFMGFWLLLRSFVAKNTLFLLFFSFIFLYTLPVYSYFFKGIYLSAHNQSFTFESANQVNLIFSLFLVVVNAYLKVPSTKDLPQIKYRYNPLIYWGVYMLSFLIVFTARRQGNVYDGSGGGGASMSSLNEYVLILFAVLYMYSNRNLLYTYLNAALFLLYAFFALSAGGRVEVVLLFMLLFTVRYSQTMSFRRVCFLFVIGAWGMTLFGKVRNDPRILLSDDVVQVINPFAEREYLLNSLNSNEGDVFWASERMILLQQEGYLPWDKRALAGASFLGSVLLPSSVMPKEAVLSQYRQDIRTTGGGGLAPIYFYVFMGLPGVILLGCFVAYILSSFRAGMSDYRYFYALFFFITSPRWVAYTPIQLIKLCVWAVLIYYVIRSVDYTLKKLYLPTNACD